MNDGTGQEHSTTEHRRLSEATGKAEDDLFTANPWYEWGPYLSERAWGTVREDYSADGNAWDFFPHDHARSRVYRWFAVKRSSSALPVASARRRCSAVVRSFPLLSLIVRSPVTGWPSAPQSS